MPVVDRPECSPPRHQDQRIWRYMSLAQFLYILEHNKLPLVRLSKMKDRFEGAPPQSAVDFVLRNEPRDQPNSVLELVRQSYDINQYLTYVSCWFRDDFESAGMWDIYGKDGVVIQSTYSRLRSAITSDLEISIGCVKYDNNPVGYQYGEALPLALRKRTYFRHENELRVVYVQDDGRPKKDQLADAKLGGKPAVDIEINVDRLIRNVFVPRKSQDWWRDLITKMLRERYHLNLELKSSWVDKDPNLGD